MIIKGTEGFLPIQNNTIRRAPAAGAGRPQGTDGCFDYYAPSVPAAEKCGFREAVATLSQQVRTHNTTGKIQELRRQVSSGEYAVSPREIAARMLLLNEEGDT